MSKNKKFFIKVDKKGMIDQKRETRDFMSFATEQTEQPKVAEEITEAVGTIFDTLDAIVGPTPEAEPLLTEVHMENYRIAQETVEEEVEEIVEEISVEEVSIELPVTDDMTKYVEQIRVVKGGVDVQLREDLQNTPATIADLQAATKLMMGNIQKSLTSLGGGGLGEKDVIEIAKLYGRGGKINLDDLGDVTTFGASSGDHLVYNGAEWAPATPTADSSSSSGTLDSSSVVSIVTDTVDSAYVNSMVDTSDFLTEAEVIALVDSGTSGFLTEAEVGALIDSGTSGFLTEAEVGALIDSGTEGFIVDTVIQAMIDSETAPFLNESEVDARVDVGVAAHVGNLNHHDSNQIRGFITSAHINPMVDAYVDSAYIINHMQWLDSVIDTAINITVDSAYVADHCRIPISHLTDVDTKGASVDDVLVYNGVNWEHRPIPSPNPSLLDYKGVVNPTLDSSGPDISDVSQLPFHGDIYVSDTSGTVDSSWSGLGGTTVLVQDVLLFDSDINGGAVGSGEWVRLGASVGGGGSITAVRGGFGIEVDDTSQPARPMVFVDSDDLANKFLRLSTPDDAKEHYFMIGKNGVDKNLVGSTTVFHIKSGLGRFTIKDASSGGNNTFFDVRDRNQNIPFEVTSDNKVRRAASLAGNMADDEEFIDKKYADEHYVRFTGGNSGTHPGGVMTGSLTIDNAEFMVKEGDGTDLLRVRPDNSTMNLNGKFTGEIVSATDRLKSLKVSSGQSSNLQLQWNDQTRMYIGNTLITNSVATQINNGPLTVYGSSDDIESKLVLTGSKTTASSGADATIEFSTRKGSAIAYLTWRESDTEGNFFRFTHDVQLNGHLNLRGTSSSDKVIQASGVTKIELANSVVFPRLVAVNSSGDGFKIGGTDETGTFYPNGLLRVYHNNNTTADAINYYGKSDSPTNLVNYGTVQSMVSDGITSTVDKNYIRNTGDISGLITSTVNKSYIRTTGDISGLITSTVDQDYIRNTGNISNLITNTVDTAYVQARSTSRGRPFNYRGTGATSLTKGGFTWNDGTSSGNNPYITFSIEDEDGNGNIPMITYTTIPTVNAKGDAYFPITITNSGGEIHMHGTIRGWNRVNITSSGLRGNRGFFWGQNNVQFWNNGPTSTGFNLGQTYYFQIGGMM